MPRQNSHVASQLLSRLLRGRKSHSLPPLEEAELCEHLVTHTGMSQREVAKKLGVSESALSHMRRLLNLEEPIQRKLAAGLISVGHAKALLTVAGNERRITLAEQVVIRGWSVRRLEDEIAGRVGPRSPVAAIAQKPTEKDRDILRLEQELTDQVGSPVKIDRGDSGWILSIHCTDLDILEGVIDRLRGRTSTWSGEAW